jgi:hypothetical protein
MTQEFKEFTRERCDRSSATLPFTLAHYSASQKGPDNYCKCTSGNTSNHRRYMSRHIQPKAIPMLYFLQIKLHTSWFFSSFSRFSIPSRALHPWVCLKLVISIGAVWYNFVPVALFSTTTTNLFTWVY